MICFYFGTMTDGTANVVEVYSCVCRKWNFLHMPNRIVLPMSICPQRRRNKRWRRRRNLFPQNSIRYVRYLDTKTFSRNDSRDVWIYICVLQRFEERKRKGGTRSARTESSSSSRASSFSENRCCCSRDTRVEFVLFQSLLQDSGWSLVVRTKLYVVFSFCVSLHTHTHNHRFDDGKRIRDDALVCGNLRKRRECVWNPNSLHHVVAVAWEKRSLFWIWKHPQVTRLSWRRICWAKTMKRRRRRTRMRRRNQINPKRHGHNNPKTD